MFSTFWWTACHFDLPTRFFFYFEFLADSQAWFSALLPPADKKKNKKQQQGIWSEIWSLETHVNAKWEAVLYSVVIGSFRTDVKARWKLGPI